MDAVYNEYGNYRAGLFDFASQCHEHLWDIPVKYSNELLIRHLESAQNLEFVGLRPTPKPNFRVALFLVCSRGR
jgi:hypothetical protein